MFFTTKTIFEVSLTSFQMQRLWKSSNTELTDLSVTHKDILGHHHLVLKNLNLYDQNQFSSNNNINTESREKFKRFNEMITKGKTF